MCVILLNEISYLESEYRRYIYLSEGIRILPKECIQPEYGPKNRSPNSVKLSALYSLELASTASPSRRQAEQYDVIVAYGWNSHKLNTGSGNNSILVLTAEVRTLVCNKEFSAIWKLAYYLHIPFEFASIANITS